MDGARRRVGPARRALERCRTGQADCGRAGRRTLTWGLPRFLRAVCNVGSARPTTYRDDLDAQATECRSPGREPRQGREANLSTRAGAAH